MNGRLLSTDFHIGNTVLSECNSRCVQNVDSCQYSASPGGSYHDEHYLRNFQSLKVITIVEAMHPIDTPFLSDDTL